MMVLNYLLIIVNCMIDNEQINIKNFTPGYYL